MVLDYHGDLVLGSVFGEFAQSIRGPAHSFLVAARTLRVDANAEAAEKLRGFDPLVVILDGLLAPGFIGVAQRPFVVDHDQTVFDAQVLRPFLEFGEVLLVPRLVFEELIDILDCVNPVVHLRDFGEVEVVQLLREERAMKRPLGKGDLEHRLLVVGVSARAAQAQQS